MPDIKCLVDQYAAACQAYDYNRSVCSSDVGAYNRVTNAMTDLLRAVLEESGYSDVRVVL